MTVTQQQQVDNYTCEMTQRDECTVNVWLSVMHFTVAANSFQFDVFNVWCVGLNEHPDTHIVNMLTSIRRVSSGKHLKASQTSLLLVTKLIQKMFTWGK